MRHSASSIQDRSAFNSSNGTYPESEIILQVKGFSLRSWLTKNKTKVNPILEALRKLIEAGKLQISFTDYDLATELKDALDHAASEGANSKVLLRMSEVGGPKPLDVEA